jgi:hypothetical protein
VRLAARKRLGGELVAGLGDPVGRDLSQREARELLSPSFELALRVDLSFSSNSASTVSV